MEKNHGLRRWSKLALVLALVPLLQAETCAVYVPRHAEYGTWADSAVIDYLPGGFCTSDPWGTGGGRGPRLDWYGVPAWLDGQRLGWSRAPMWLYSEWGSHRGELVARYQPVSGTFGENPAYHTLQFDTGNVWACDPSGRCYFWRLAASASGFGYTFISGWTQGATQCVNARAAILQCPGSPSVAASYYAPFYCYQPTKTTDTSACKAFLMRSSGRDGGTGCCAQVRAAENPAEPCGVYPFGDPY